MVDILGIKAEEYWDEERSISYSKKRSIQKNQQAIFGELLSISERRGLTLDVGCGPGFGSRLVEAQSAVLCLDISFPMCRIANSNGLTVVCADFLKIPFRDETFERIISVSAVQWIWGRSREEVLNNYAALLLEFSRVLVKSGEVLLQFYPQTRREFEEFIRLSKRWFISKVFIVGAGRKSRELVKLIKK